MPRQSKERPMNTNKAFKCGSDAALDAMDVLGKTFDGKHNAYAKDALAGSLKELMLAVYAMAPDDRNRRGTDFTCAEIAKALDDWERRNDCCIKWCESPWRELTDAYLSLSLADC